MTTVSPSELARRDEDAARLEERISNLLRLGVAASLALVVTGTFVSFVRHPEYLVVPQPPGWPSSPAFASASTVSGVVAGVRQFQGRAIVDLGLLLLIAIPVVRVLLAIVEYFRQGDWAYVCLTTLVLAVLILSFYAG